MKKFRILFMAIAVCGSSSHMTPVWGDDIMKAIEDTMQKAKNLANFPPLGPCDGSGYNLGECNAKRCWERHQACVQELKPNLMRLKEFLGTQQEAQNQINALWQQSQQAVASYEQKAATVEAQYAQTIQSQVQSLAAVQQQIQVLTAENDSYKKTQMINSGSSNGSGGHGGGAPYNRPR